MESRNLVRRRFAMSLGVVAIIGLIAMLLAGQGGNDRIMGSGSTAVQPLVQKLSVDFQTARSGDSDWTPGSSGIDYDAVGSLGGVMRLADPEMDFAIADYRLSADHLADLKAVQFPILIGSISPVYRLGEQSAAPLRFSAPTLAGIFGGRIVTWSDPAIGADNPGVVLPDTPIKVVRRTDGSGTTLNFSTYLARGDADWKSRFGAGTTLKWDTGIGAQGSSEMARSVAATEGAIGYLETGQARRAGLSVGMVRNDAGRFVAPTDANVQAGTRTVVAGPADEQSALNAYPLTSVFHAVMKRQNASPSDNERALRLFSFLFERAPAAARSLGYVPLPASEVAEVRKLWARELGANSLGAAAASN